MRDNIRIPVFTGEFLFNVYDEFEVMNDEVKLEWIAETWEPEVWEKYVGPRYDKIAHYELHRLLKFGTCPFCRSKMSLLDKETQPGNVYVCKECFYWGGRGTRGMFEGPLNGRGILGRMNIIENTDEVPEDVLINHLAKHTDDIIKLTPKKAEKIVPVILKDYLKCEVKAIGGVKDNGIDALAIRSDRSKMIVQIKWREKNKGAEAVSVVREVGGTLLSRGIPSGLIISTKNKFSVAAVSEADLISKRNVTGLGRLNIQFAAFSDLIDMFNISCKKKSEIKRPEEIIPYYEAYDLFG